MSHWDAISTADRKRIGRWQIVIAIVAIMGKLCLAGDWYGFAAALSFVSDDLGMSRGQAGLAQGAIAITYGFGMFFWSPISRRFSGRAFFSIGLGVTGVAMLAQTVIHSMAALVALRLLIGFFEAGVWVGSIKLVFGWFPKTRRSAIMGVILAAYSLAITLDFSVGIPLSAAYGWRVFFAGLGIFTIATAILGAVIARPGPAALGLSGFTWEDAPLDPSSVRPAHKLTTIFKSKWLYIGGFGIFGDTFALAATATWVVPSFVAEQHMPEQSGALIGALMGLSQVAFLLIGGYLSDRISRTRVIQIGAVLGSLSALLFLFATIWTMPFAMLLAITGLSGVAVFSGGAIFGLLGEKYPDELAPAATGYAEVWGMASTFAAPAAMGFAVDITHTFFAAFMVFTVTEFVILGLLLVLCRESFARDVVPLASAEPA
jgi:MFS family permease